MAEKSADDELKHVESSLSAAHQDLVLKQGLYDELAVFRQAAIQLDQSLKAAKTSLVQFSRTLFRREIDARNAQATYLTLQETHRILTGAAVEPAPATKEVTAAEFFERHKRKRSADSSSSASNEPPKKIVPVERTQSVDSSSASDDPPKKIVPADDSECQKAWLDGMNDPDI